MNYQQALEYIHGTMRFGSQLGLDRIRDLLERLGNPHHEFKSVHVAGTNGKGSVCSMITSVLSEQGYKVGMFISPYLEDFTERIQISGKQIPEENLARITELVKGKVDEMVKEGKGHPTEFELITAIGFVYFAEQKVDAAVVEVGLGGRFDATNVVNPVLSVITSISFDHMDVLGDTLAKIAFEKAGIIKAGKPVVSYPQHPEAARVLEEVAGKQEAPLTVVVPEQIEPVSSEFDRQVFNYSYGEERLDGLTIHLSGKHQLLNAATALTSVMVLREIGFPISRDAIYRGMEKARWPGRLERLQKDPDIIIDGAHNEAGAQALAAAMKEYFPDRRMILVLGVLKDKEVEKILKALCSLASKVIATKPDNPRALEADQLAEKVKKYCRDVEPVPGIEDAVHLAVGSAGPEDLILVSGSLYLIGKVRKIIKSHE